ncbi:ABC transporter permease [Acidipila rosea]|uniref:Putative ABC transport system permease protein n=1 Tax=Acidipila rosea TaxID=768535 RepID=A0A4R1L271_9BACT|nr:FtsX-like permease family protein [Acidipila rosea]TCK70229.1 putative ABC transport system permease protein [Acidipila rosea]
MSTVTNAPTLAWKTAAKIAIRELHASRAKFLFVVLSVAIGVAALTGVRGFSESFQKALLNQARSIMAADLSARMFHQTTPQQNQQLDALAVQGVRRTTVTEMVSMVSAEGDPVPLLVSLKVVDPAEYPFYGTVQLDPTQPFTNALTDNTVVVDDNLLVRLRVRIGDSLKIGGQHFRIAAVLLREPDRMTAGIGLGPRVMMTRRAVEETGLLQPESRATERYLFELPPNKAEIASIRAKIEKILPDAQVSDFRETSPALTEGLNRSTSLLSLICLVAMVLGAIGVAMAMRSHLQQRIEVLAIMKSIGARSSGILRIYLLQTLLLGSLGALLGVIMGLGVEWIFPSLLGKLLPLRPPLTIPWRSISAAFGTGVLTTLLFCLPPLLDIRHVRPSVVLRRTIESGGDGTRTMIGRLRTNKAEWLSIIVIVAALGGIAAALSDSMVVGKWFAAALCTLLVFVLALASATLRVLHAFLDRTRLHLNSAVRHGLANLYRPGNQSAAVLAALGTGVMLILSVFLMQRAVVHDMRLTADPKIPNVFLIDISSTELPGLKKLLSGQAGVQGKMEALPIVSARVDSIDGVKTEDLKVKNYPKRLLRSLSLTWSDAQPPGVKIIAGKWFAAGNPDGIAIADRVAKRLKLHPGSELVFYAGERIIRTHISAIYNTDGQHVWERSEFILPSKALEGLPTIWYAAIHVDPMRIGAVQRAVFDTFPTVTVINIADILETLQGLVHQITVVIRFLAGFSILSGAVILASSIASTRYRRIREVVVLKTLGATRNRIAAVFSVEFMVLGVLAGAVGAVFANLLSRILLHKMDVPFHYSWVGSVAAVLGTAILATAAGWAASFRMLGQKPLEVLREE